MNDKQNLLDMLIERVRNMDDEQIAKVILDVWSDTDVASLLKQNEELKKQNEELKKIIEQKFYGDKRDMYLNPEKHTGGSDNIDIEGFNKTGKEILQDKQKMLNLLKNTGLHDDDGKLKKDIEF